jgi:CPA1 family monovalent cation:H+ antiporter
LRKKDNLAGEAIDRLRGEYSERIQQLEQCAESPEEYRAEVATPQYQRLQQRAFDAEREAIIRLRNQQVINHDALRRIQRDLDLAEARLIS